MKYVVRYSQQEVGRTSADQVTVVARVKKFPEDEAERI